MGLNKGLKGVDEEGERGMSRDGLDEEGVEVMIPVGSILRLGIGEEERCPEETRMESQLAELGRGEGGKGRAHLPVLRDETSAREKLLALDDVGDVVLEMDVVAMFHSCEDDLAMKLEWEMGKPEGGGEKERRSRRVQSSTLPSSSRTRAYHSVLDHSHICERILPSGRGEKRCWKGRGEDGCWTEGAKPRVS